MTDWLPITWLHPELDLLAELPGGVRATLTRVAAASPGAVVRVGAVALLAIAPGSDPLGAVQRARAAAVAALHTAAARSVVPFFAPVTDEAETAAPPPRARLRDSWFGLLPGGAWTSDARAAFIDLLHTLHPGRVPLFLALENAALGGADLTDAWEQQAPPVLAPVARDGGPLLVAVCGIDGSGKSSQLAALRTFVAGRGLRVGVHKIFRHGVFHDTVTDVVRQCAPSQNLHLWRIERLAKVFDSVKVLVTQIEAALATHDVLLFDRYVYTHLAAMTGRMQHDSFTREMLSVFPRPHAVFLLDVPVEVALTRIGNRDARTLDENAYMLGRYRTKLLDLAADLGFIVLDAEAPFDVNQEAMREHVSALLVRADAGGGGAR